MKFSTNEVYNAKVIKFKGKLKGSHDGLGILVRGLTSVKNAGGNMKLAAISTKVEGVLAITKLNSVFEQYPTVEAASESF